jgi:hypothetical protein
MHDPTNILMFDCIITALIALDLAWVLVKGHARSWLGSRITRQQQPAQYRRYLYESAGMLGICLAVFSYAILSTDWPV